jgi:hypothetical protein
MKLAQTNLNKTRLRIDQKLGKSLALKSGSSKVLCASPKLLKQNIEPSLSCVKSSDNDTDCTDSHSMFDSNDIVNSQGKMPRKVNVELGKTVLFRLKF